LVARRHLGWRQRERLLTVLRHETNVSVLKGARGGMPHSLWLVSYAGLERMYYDTVAGFAYWEGDPEKLETLIFFIFLRQSFEDNILLLRYGILRNSEHFWPFYDWLNDWNFSKRGDDAGWLDLTYYDAPET
jgi:hypothetical protein